MNTGLIDVTRMGAEGVTADADGEAVPGVPVDKSEVPGRCGGSVKTPWGLGIAGG
jgi:hypothetical protein